MREEIKDFIEDYGDDELLFADGFDDAIIGITSTKGKEDVVCYDYEKGATVAVPGDLNRLLERYLV